MFDLASAWRGIKAIRLPYAKPKPGWKIVLGYKGASPWFELWTPIWHEGRGPYVSIGLWFIFIYRGY